MPSTLFSPTPVSAGAGTIEDEHRIPGWSMRRGGAVDIAATQLAVHAPSVLDQVGVARQPRSTPKEMQYAVGHSKSLGYFILGLDGKGERIMTLRLLPEAYSAVSIKDATTELVRELALRFPCAALSPSDSHVSALLQKAETVLDGSPQDPAVTSAWHLLLSLLDLSTGSEAQQATWAALLRIPLGHTSTYADLAQDAGLGRSASRAVANACGANPVAVLVPCHRVLRSDGGLGGYHWGVSKKKLLLRKEGVKCPSKA